MAELVRLKDAGDSLDRGFEKGYEQGLTTHVKSLDKHFRWMTGHVIIFFGMPNYSKSTLVNQLLMLRAIKEGKKFALWSPEFAPLDFFYLDLMHTYLGKSPHYHHRVNKMNRDEFEYAKEFVHDHFFYFKVGKGGDYVKNINDGFKRVIDEHGINTIVTDPYNKIRGMRGDRDDHILEDFFDIETAFAQDNNVSNIIVMHTNGSVGREESGNFKMPDIFNVAGGAMTGNRVEDMIAIHRPYGKTDPDDTIMWVESVKIKKPVLCGKRGRISMYFDPIRNRIIDGVVDANDNVTLYDPFNNYMRWVEFGKEDDNEPLPF